MIVCLCNGISDRTACAIARDRSCRNVNDIYRCLGCRVQCGKCVPEMKRLFRDTQRASEEREAAGGMSQGVTRGTHPG